MRVRSESRRTWRLILYNGILRIFLSAWNCKGLQIPANGLKIRVSAVQVRLCPVMGVFAFPGLSRLTKITQSVSFLFSVHNSHPQSKCAVHCFSSPGRWATRRRWPRAGASARARRRPCAKPDSATQSSGHEMKCGQRRGPDETHGSPGRRSAGAILENSKNHLLPESVVRPKLMVSGNCEYLGCAIPCPWGS